MSSSTSPSSNSGNTNNNNTTDNQLSQKDIIDMVRDYQFIIAGTCPGTERFGDCYYPKTNFKITQDLEWKCNPGNFCVTPFDSNACSPGFYCPKDTAQPIYCPQKYYCSRDTKKVTRCPANYFCPLGTVDPLPCTLGICGEGSVTGVKVLLFPILFCWFVQGFLCMRLLRKCSDFLRRRKDRLKPIKSRFFSKEQLISSPQDNKSAKKLSIEFQNLSLRINDTQILRNLTGKLESGRTCAIMGPSGSGKTSLISVLMGKRPLTSGRVTINGGEVSMTSFKKLIGYVPQDDIMLRELTVEETLLHSAEMRLPRSYTRKQIKDKVGDIISFLGLYGVHDSVIGDEVNRGISGGQRRRVNIGMELVAEPSILFLDEPTSGVDSTNSKEICNLLREVANQNNILCAAIIHSPNPAAFNEFDDLILLGKGGEMVYIGPRDQAPAYFTRIGFDLKPGESASDFYMDVISGNVQNSLDPNFEPQLLFNYWKRYVAGKEPLGLIATADLETGRALNRSISVQLRTSKEFDNETKEPVDPLSLRIWNYIERIPLLWAIKDFLLEIIQTVFSPLIRANRQTPMWPYKFILLIKRALVQLYRNKETILLGQILHAVCGTFLSLGVQYFTYLGPQPQIVCNYAPVQLQNTCRSPIDFIGPLGVLMCMGAIFTSTSDGTLTFGLEQTVYWRETATGMPTSAYFLAKIISDIFKVAINAFMFSVCFISVYPNRASLQDIYLIVLALYFNGYALGYFLSTFISRKSISLACTGTCLLFPLVLSGQFISLVDAERDYLPIFFLWQLSASRWAIEAFWIKEVSNRPFLDVPLPPKYKWGNFEFALGQIYISTLFWLALSFGGLKIFNRRKQK